MKNSQISLSDTLLSLYSRTGTNPLPLEKSAIEAYASLLGIPGWDLDFQSEFSIGMNLIISFGFCLLQLQQCEKVDELRQTIASEAVKNPIDPQLHLNDFAELSAAALCALLGATDIEKLKTRKEKTPDFKVIWGNDEVEVEVTHAIDKKAHKDMKQFANEIAAKLKEQTHLLGQNLELIIYLSDIPTDDDKKSLLSNVHTIEPGRFVEMKERWHLYVRRGSQEAEAPDWWQTDCPTLFQLHTVAILDQVNGAVTQLQIQIFMNVSAKAYLNSAQNKADHGQGNNKIPFLLAIDVTNLPNAFDEYRHNLSGYWDNWMNISGIMLFTGFNGSERMGWYWELFPNPTTHLPLPRDLLERRTEVGHLLEASVSLHDSV